MAIVGYTNAGKSSLLNRLTDAGVLVEDALFATLDPTTRRTRTADGRDYTLTDTVGLRPAPAAPAGRVVPFDAGGDRRRRPAGARRRRLRRASGGPGRRGPGGARRDRRACGAGDRGRQQDRRRRRDDADPAAAPAAGCGLRVGPHRGGHRAAAAGRSPVRCRTRRSRCGC